MLKSTTLKNSFIVFTFFFTLVLFHVNTVLAKGLPVSGVDVAVRKHPGGGNIAQGATGRDGTFSARTPEGEYTLSFSYAQAVKLSGNKAAAISFTLSLPQGGLVDGKAYYGAPIAVSGSFQGITITMRTDGIIKCSIEAGTGGATNEK